MTDTGVEDKAVIITGGGRGIGEALAVGLAAAGAHVIIVDNGSDMEGSGKDPSIASRVAEHVRDRGGTGIGICADVTSAGDVEHVIGVAEERWGRLDAVVNAAGTFVLGDVLSVTLDTWAAIQSVHIVGSLLVTQAACRWWTDRDLGGAVVNFTSSAGLMGIGGLGAYSTAKAGVIGLTLASANALATKRIRVNAVAPNASSRMAEAGIIGGLLEGASQVDAESLLSGPDLRPSNVLPLVTYLISDAGSGTTGTVFLQQGLRYARMQLPAPELDHITVAEDPNTASQELAHWLAHRVEPIDQANSGRSNG